MGSGRKEVSKRAVILGRRLEHWSGHYVRVIVLKTGKAMTI